MRDNRNVAITMPDVKGYSLMRRVGLLADERVNRIPSAYLFPNADSATAIIAQHLTLLFSITCARASDRSKS